MTRCRDCWHYTPAVDHDGLVWCGHSRHHGWIDIELPERCGGEGFESYEARSARHAALIAAGLTPGVDG